MLFRSCSPATFPLSSSLAVSLRPAHGMASFALSSVYEVEKRRSASARPEGRAPRGLVQDPSPRLAHSVGGIGEGPPWLREEHGATIQYGEPHSISSTCAASYEMFMAPGGGFGVRGDSGVKLSFRTKTRRSIGNSGRALALVLWSVFIMFCMV